MYLVISSYLYLVENFHSTLSFDEHVMQITSKCIASLCQINRVRHVLDKKTLMTVINALVFSRLFYCSSVWGGISMKNVLKLQSVQNYNFNKEI